MIGTIIVNAVATLLAVGIFVYICHLVRQNDRQAEEIKRLSIENCHLRDTARAVWLENRARRATIVWRAAGKYEEKAGEN